MYQTIFLLFTAAVQLGMSVKFGNTPQGHTALVLSWISIVGANVVLALS